MARGAKMDPDDHFFFTVPPHKRIFSKRRFLLPKLDVSRVRPRELYERGAIEQWFDNHDTDPETGEVLESKLLFPNRRLRSLIREFQATHMAELAEAKASLQGPAPQPAWAVWLEPSVAVAPEPPSTPAGESSDLSASQAGRRGGRGGRGGRGQRGRQAE